MENKVTIGFEYTNEFGDHYEAKSTFMPSDYEDGGELNDMGEAFNNFLRQMGFIRHNDYILMQDLTEDELEAVESFLSDLREEAKV